MKILNRNKDHFNLPDKAATGIANGILKSQQWFVTSLQGLTKSWTPRQQWIFLYLICLVFGGASVIAIVVPFQSSAPLEKIISKAISTPQNINKEGKSYKITNKEFQQIQEYKGKYPNLLKERPALYDSLRLIEQSYYSQQK